jgi:tRNA(fMet)-specific endonuclease VapC
MTIADTDVLIDYLAGRGAGAAAVEKLLRQRALATTTISRFELQAGARTARQRKTVGTLLQALEAYPLDAASADEAAGVRLVSEARGQGIGMADSLIAGITLLRGARLLTRNRAQFEGVAGLELVTP